MICRLFTLFFLTYFLFPHDANAQSSTVFKFHLDTAAKTSAGVFKNDGTLVRTLWNGVDYKTGNHTARWDGKDDAGADVPNGAYNIRVRSNNVHYDWEGVIGNTSAAATGGSVFQSSELATDVLIVGDYGYVCASFSEGKASQSKFLLSNPNSKLPIGSGLPTTAQSTEIMCSDGINVYYAGIDAYYSSYNKDHNDPAFEPNGKEITKSFVFATKVSDETQVIFSGGVNPFPVTISTPDHYDSGIDPVYTTEYTYSRVTGMTVQKNGNKLFVARNPNNTIHVLDKTTGALLYSNTMVLPRRIYADEDTLWVISGDGLTNTLSRFIVNSDGSLTSTPFTLSGATLSNPIAVTVSPSGELVVTDAGKSHQIKFFNKQTGAYIHSFGQAGGYWSDPRVMNDKFMFKDGKWFQGKAENGSIAFASDGSFLINDVGNLRVQHFAADGTYINNVMSIGFNYAVQVDSNDPTRVFSNYLEFSIDYSKPLSPSNGSWRLNRNWAQKVGYDIGMSTTLRLKDVTTLSNGRTYALQPNGTGKLEMVELSDTGMRYTGFVPVWTGQNDDQQYSLEADGSMIFQETDGNGNFFYSRRPLTGFINNIPLYASNAPHAGTSLLDIHEVTVDDPLTSSTMKSRQTTSSGIRVTFAPERKLGWHLGGIKDNKWLWKASPSTFREYMGNFPTDGTFDIGNTVEHAGGTMQTYDRNIFYNYVGEFWGAYSTPNSGQTNKWNHFYDDGLLVGQFGVVANETQGIAQLGMAGNSYGSAITKVGDAIYVYHGDESHHGGVHRWKISGLNTINEQNIPTTIPAIQTPYIPNYVDLMEGLPFYSILPDTIAGWKRIPANDITIKKSNGSEANFWSVKTSIRTYNKKNGDDLTAYIGNNQNDASITRSLGLNKGLSSWSISGAIQLKGLPNFAGQGNNGGGVFFEVLDNNDKVIARFNWATDYGLGWFLGNGQKIFTDKVAAIQYIAEREHSLLINVDSGIVTFAYADYPEIKTRILADPTANWANPTKLRINFKNEKFEKQINVKELKFRKSATYYRSKNSGDWSTAATWETSSDGEDWVDARDVPTNNAGSIFIQNGHTVAVSDSVTVDELTVNDGAVLNVESNGTLIVNDGEGDDVTISPAGSMVVKSDSFGTGRIGNSSGTVKGNVTVERYISAKANASSRLLSPSVTTATPIRSNWQEGVNNLTSALNLNQFPGHGTHITGSKTGARGFDATSGGQPSLFTYNQVSPTPTWAIVNNTDVNTLDNKKGYLIFIKGDRGININSNSTPTNTTLRATGTLSMGTVTFNGLEGVGRSSLITNPYASPISWQSLLSANSGNFENYYTLWDPSIGSQGGYVTVDETGMKSVRTSIATLEIQTGQAFLVKAKAAAISPSFIVKESDKRSANVNILRTSGAAVSKFYASLYYTDAKGARNLADGALARFDDSYSSQVDGNDAEDMVNFDENIAFTSNGKMFSIQSLPFKNKSDTLFLALAHMKEQAYEWQFNATDFELSSIYGAYLQDKFLGTQTPVAMTGPSIVKFTVTSNPASAASDRFSILLLAHITLQANLVSLRAAKVQNGVKFDWKTTTEVNMERYDVEKSADAQAFSFATNVAAKGSSSSVNDYSWFDDDPFEGYNYYRVRSVSKDGSVQVSEAVRVMIDKAHAHITISPNPVQSQEFRLNLVNMRAGKYTAVLINSAGQTVLTQNINYSGGINSQNIKIGKGLAKGIYQLKLIGENETFTQKMFKQ